ncbi:hypothetical protein BDI4_1500010 [Burkholderia diffusa]|nr:hypothetical protein BDI4_1500010 [Burkholderia diffusa]
MGSAERHDPGCGEAAIHRARRIAEERHGVLTCPARRNRQSNQWRSAANIFIMLAASSPALGSQAVPARRLVALSSNPV